MLTEVKNQVMVLKKLFGRWRRRPTMREAYQRLEGAAFKIAESMYGGSGDDPA